MIKYLEKGRQGEIEEQNKIVETNINMVVKFKKKSINILNMNRLSIPNKREKLTNYMKKKDFTTFYKR